jgi:asparagine synthetase B (glutamine-hydrolysing)
MGFMPKLTSVVELLSSANEVALLLSGGIDSYSVGVACEMAGKTVNAYTYELEGVPSTDRPKAERLARLRSWNLKVVIVPTGDLSNDFLRLVAVHGCRKKVQAEVTFPMMYVLPVIEEDVIFSGWNADDHYANTASDQRELALAKRRGASDAELAALFDEIRQRQYLKFDKTDSEDAFRIACRIASAHSKQLLDPYSHVEIRDYFAL